MAVPIGVVTAIGAATLASNRRSEILMTLVFPLAATTLARSGAALRERRTRRAGERPAVAAGA
jgi:hypothetical protein